TDQPPTRSALLTANSRGCEGFGGLAQSGLHCARRAGIDGIERCRAADVEPVPEHAAEAQIGDSLRDVDLAEQLAGWVVAADAVLVRIAPAHRAPDIALGIGAHAVGNAGFGHLGKHFAVRNLPGSDIDVEEADM